MKGRAAVLCRYPRRCAGAADYALDLAHPGGAALADRPGFDNHHASMDKAGQTLVVSRSAPVQLVQIYLADAEGHAAAMGRGEPGSGRPSLCAPICPRTVRRHLNFDQGGRWQHAALEDDHAR